MASLKRSNPVTPPDDPEFNIDESEAVESQIASARDEILVLVKKAPHDALSKFKLTVVNALLARANALLVERRPMQGFDAFDVEVLPSVSDVAMVCGQYLATLENLRVHNIVQDLVAWYWAPDGAKTKRRTYPPRKLER
jgi:hypothetical protein